MGELLILKIGTTFPNTAQKLGDFDDWTLQGLRLTRNEVKVVDIEHGEDLPAADECSGVVITGSHPNVTENLPWSVAIERWLPEIIERGIPFLGICYGHQLLARAAGGEVGFHPGGKEIGTVDVDLLPTAATDALFHGVPDCFPVHVAHAQTVLATPPGAVVLAANEHEATQAFRLGSCAWGVQFHPEYTTEVMQSYIEEQTTQLHEMGFDVNELLDSVRETSVAAGILANFARFVERTEE